MRNKDRKGKHEHANTIQLKRNKTASVYQIYDSKLNYPLTHFIEFQNKRNTYLTYLLRHKFSVWKRSGQKAAPTMHTKRMVFVRFDTKKKTNEKPTRQKNLSTMMKKMKKNILKNI